jgi:NADPH:quinone reductase-like Zn-dependent oxidoreductase
VRRRAGEHRRQAGQPAGTRLRTEPAPLDFLNRKTLRLAKRHGVRYEYLFMHPSGEQLAQLGRLLAEGSVRTIVDKVFPLDQVREALAYSEAGHATGKVVVEVKAAA